MLQIHHLIMIGNFWGVMPCSRVDIFQCSGGIYAIFRLVYTQHHKTVIFILISMRTSDLAWHYCLQNMLYQVFALYLLLKIKYLRTCKFVLMKLQCIYHSKIFLHLYPKNYIAGIKFWLICSETCFYRLRQLISILNINHLPSAKSCL